MTVHDHDEEGFHIISINGDLDASSSIILDTALEKAMNSDKKIILIDCQKLNYISSPGIGVFTSRLDDCEKSNTRIVLYSMNDKVFNVFKILGLNQLIPIKNSKEEAKLFINDIQHTNTL